MNSQARSDVVLKLKVLGPVQVSENVTFTCRHFEISRETFYQWKRAYVVQGEAGLINRKLCPAHLELRIAALVEAKIFNLRRTDYFGQCDQLSISGY